LCSFYYVILEFPASGAIQQQTPKTRTSKEFNTLKDEFFTTKV